MRASFVHGAIGALVVGLRICMRFWYANEPERSADHRLAASDSDRTHSRRQSSSAANSRSRSCRDRPSGVTWQSADPSIVSVGSDGMVSARSSGVGRVIATSGGSHDTAFITVRNAAASLSLTPDSLTMSLGDSSTLQLAVLDSHGAPLDEYRAGDHRLDVARSNRGDRVRPPASSRPSPWAERRSLCHSTGNSRGPTCRSRRAPSRRSPWSRRRR